jgi:hypothetical protein
VIKSKWLRYIFWPVPTVQERQLYETAVAEKFIDIKLPFVNVDIITRGLPGGYTSENFAKADEIARKQIGDYRLHERLHD